jgi:MFS family permease
LLLEHSFVRRASLGNSMTVRQQKAGYFAIEGLHAFASSFYFYYLFFFMARRFGFSNLGNLSLAALNGFVYMFMAWFGGRFGQRFGYFKALRVGLGTMTLGLIVGSAAHSLSVQVGVLMTWTIGLCFTWPVLEALASENEDPLGLQRMVGIYNLVWATSSAFAYFSGGLLIEKLGDRSLFLIPASIYLLEMALTFWLQRSAVEVGPKWTGDPLLKSPELNPRPIARTRAFLQMAWWSNPFAYVAINTVAAVVPSLAPRLGLTPRLAGFFCSVWFFARVGAFLLLWIWTGWHYRLRWLLGAYLLLIGSFATILLVPHLGAILIAQVGFGFAVGLLYYSSLYYSMDVGEAKGDHGGVHESAIGAGIFAGPAIGAATLHFMPSYPNSSTLAVSVTLFGGLVGLLIVIVRSRRAQLAFSGRQ